MIKTRIAVLPEHTIRVNPSEHQPGSMVTKVVDNISQEPKVTETFVPWVMDSKIAQLLGESKSLPNGVMHITYSEGIGAHEEDIAWYCNRLGLNLSRKGQDYFLYKAKNKRGGEN